MQIISFAFTDKRDQRLFWSVNEQPGISTSYFNGSNFGAFEKTSNAFGVAIYGDVVFYSEYSNSTIKCYDITTGIESVFYTDPQANPIYDVLIVEFQGNNHPTSYRLNRILTQTCGTLYGST